MLLNLITETRIKQNTKIKPTVWQKGNSVICVCLSNEECIVLKTILGCENMSENEE